MLNMQKPWMPVVAGILDIVSGSVGVLMGLFMALHLHGARAVQGVQKFGGHAGGFPGMPPFFPGMGLALGITLMVLGVLAIIGGIFSLRVKNWGLALAGAIGAVITGRLLGVLALIFIVLGKKDFQNP
jgi:hypothetical protein